MEKLQTLIWYEKYRQKELKQLVLPKEHRIAFKKFIKDGEIPHLLFFGPAGGGKTTTAMILINELSSSNLIMNASSEDRGIQNIRGKVKRFATSKRTSKKLKIALFDEFDGMLGEAQRALKNTIEKFQSNCRFIFTANDINQVIPEIISRCIPYRFDTIPKKRLIKHLKMILESEEIKYKEKNIEKIIDRFYPDVRSTINIIQACSISGKLNPKQVIDSFDPKIIKDYIKNGKLFALRNTWNKTVDFIWLYKYLFNQFIPKEINEKIRSEAMLTVAEYLYRDKTVADREINMAACCLELMNLLEVEINFEKVS